MDSSLAGRATAAASSLARDLDLEVDDVAVVQNSNKLTLRLLPCDVLARIAVVGQEVAAFEVRMAQTLSAVFAPVASLDARVEPRVYERDDFAVTFWTYHESVTETAPPARYAIALRSLHAAMRCVEVEAPHFTERVAEAEALLTDRHRTPALLDADRVLLLETLRGGRDAVCGRAKGDQLLHGEPHPGNVLVAREGLLFIDFETGCRGPVEFDVAHAPEAVGRHYPDLDPVLFQECRRLILAMLAAWRWDERDEFPDRRRHRQHLLDVISQGPPWPALEALGVEPPRG